MKALDSVITTWRNINKWLFIKWFDFDWWESLLEIRLPDKEVELWSIWISKRTQKDYPQTSFVQASTYVNFKKKKKSRNDEITKIIEILSWAKKEIQSHTLQRILMLFQLHLSIPDQHQMLQLRTPNTMKILFWPLNEGN